MFLVGFLSTTWGIIGSNVPVHANRRNSPAALQGAFSEHLQLLRTAADTPPLPTVATTSFSFITVRTPKELGTCDALILPGGESTTISLIAERSGLLEPLRDFVKVQQKPVWGTCAGMILLAERASRTKRGGQQLIGGLDVCVSRNHFGRQVESFERVLEMPFLERGSLGFRGVFIRAPVVESLLDRVDPGTGTGTGMAPEPEPEPEPAAEEEAHVSAPHVAGWHRNLKEEVEILASLPASSESESESESKSKSGIQPSAPGGTGTIVAVRQAHVVGTSFHPELTGDARMHRWWLGEVVRVIMAARQAHPGKKMC